MKRVLVVDDELPILTGLSKALRELCGFMGEIRTVVNGREAISEVSHCFYDMCFLDIKLPDINGLYVVKDINYISPETNIALMSASNLHDGLEKTVEKGEAFFIDKPFNFSKISHIMKTAMEGSEEQGARGQKKRRKFKRRTLSKTVSFSIKNSSLMEIKAGIIDVGYAGMGIETYYPLEEGQILFLRGTAHNSGVVSWCNTMNKDHYRAGIEFI